MRLIATLEINQTWILKAKLDLRDILQIGQALLPGLSIMLQKITDVSSLLPCLSVTCQSHGTGQHLLRRNGSTPCCARDRGGVGQESRSLRSCLRSGNASKYTNPGLLL